MVPFRNLTPFAFLTLLVAGSWLGGTWTFAGAAATPLSLAALDSVLGEDKAPAGAGGSAARWVPRAYIVLQLSVTAWAAIIVATRSTNLHDAAGLALSAGVTTGVFGFAAAHEMIHSRSARERSLGLLFLGSVFYMHFRVAHLYGHHRRAATPEDPATARLGEGLYAFLLRSIVGQFREAWLFEGQRSRGNRMIPYLVVEAMLLLIVALVSWRALLFLLGVAGIAVTLLESFNYVAHYGLVRNAGERLGPHHSWNSQRRMNNASLFNMGRHSDHHRHAARSYEALEQLPAGAELPCGYAGALLTALVPPLWRRMMDARAEAVMASGR
jgi:alkane 1-monooxygenase